MSVVAIMAVLLALLTGLCFTVICVIVRLLIVLRSGSKCKPGEKGPVCVLVVAGSGIIILNVTLASWLS